MLNYSLNGNSGSFTIKSSNQEASSDSKKIIDQFLLLWVNRQYILEDVSASGIGFKALYTSEIVKFSEKETFSLYKQGVKFVDSEGKTEFTEGEIKKLVKKSKNYKISGRVVLLGRENDKLCLISCPEGSINSINNFLKRGIDPSQYLQLSSTQETGAYGTIFRLDIQTSSTMKRKILFSEIAQNIEIINDEIEEMNDKISAFAPVSTESIENYNVKIDELKTKNLSIITEQKTHDFTNLPENIDEELSI